MREHTSVSVVCALAYAPLVCVCTPEIVRLPTRIRKSSSSRPAAGNVAAGHSRITLHAVVVGLAVFVRLFSWKRFF